MNKRPIPQRSLDSSLSPTDMRMIDELIHAEMKNQERERNQQQQAQDELSKSGTACSADSWTAPTPDESIAAAPEPRINLGTGLDSQIPTWSGRMIPPSPMAIARLRERSQRIANGKDSVGPVSNIIVIRILHPIN